MSFETEKSLDKIINKLGKLVICVILMAGYEIYDLGMEFINDFKSDEYLKNNPGKCEMNYIKILTIVWAIAMYVAIQLIYGAWKVRKSFLRFYMKSNFLIFLKLEINGS